MLTGDRAKHVNILGIWHDIWNRKQILTGFIRKIPKYDYMG